MMKNVLSDMTKCYGCTACYNICPVCAIQMGENEEGFIEPNIDERLCIDCGACERVCPVNTKEFSNTNNPKRIAFTADKETVYNSSSGGAFTVLAEHFLNKGGFVAGGEFTDDFLVNHIIISKNDDLDRLRRSKYLQSNQGRTYTEAKTILDEGGTLLYCGCPCQIAGLKNYLGKEYSNLITVDLLCHGSPSLVCYREYLDHKGGVENIKKIEMRRRDGWGVCFKIIKNNGEILNHYSQKDIFMRGFLNDIFNRPSCYGCSFSRLPRQGDITLGDLWTAKRLRLGMPYEKKGSLVLLNSEKGEKIWKASLTESKREVYYEDLTEKYPIEKFNSNIRIPSIAYDKKQRRDTFFQNYRNVSFEQTALRTLFDYNVGLILFMSDNYGSTATNVALYKAVERLGYHPIILDTLSAIEGVSKNYATDRLALSSKYFDRDDWESINYLCDSFILGSDQSLNWDFSITKKYMEYILMGFTPANKRRLTYAASFGRERYNVGTELKHIYSHMLKRFNAISVREDYAVKMCKDNFEVDAEHVMDPVFLIQKEDYLDIAKESTISFDEEPYLLAYIRDPSPEKRQVILEAANYYNVKPIVICDAHMYSKIKKQLGMDTVIEKPEFVDWMAYYANANYVITDSFHGTCFSIIFEKQFVSIKAGAKGRFDSLASILDADGIERSFFLDTAKGLVGKMNIFPQRDYIRIRQLIHEASKKSYQWLKSVLESEVSAVEKADMKNVLVDYTGLFRQRNLLQATVNKYGYEEWIERKNAQHYKEGYNYIESQNLLYKGEIPSYVRSAISKINDLNEYFSYVKTMNKYTLLITCKDDCSKHWDRFKSVANMSFSVVPKFHYSYIAIIDNDSIEYEESSNQMLIKNHLIKSTMTTEDGFLLKPLYITLISQRYDSENQFQKSKIMVNNIDYSINKRGLNVAVIDRTIGEVVDAFYIDLHGDSNIINQKKVNGQSWSM